MNRMNVEPFREKTRGPLLPPDGRVGIARKLATKKFRSLPAVRGLPFERPQTFFFRPTENGNPPPVLPAPPNLPPAGEKLVGRTPLGCEILEVQWVTTVFHMPLARRFSTTARVMLFRDAMLTGEGERGRRRAGDETTGRWCDVIHRRLAQRGTVRGRSLAQIGVRPSASSDQRPGVSRGSDLVHRETGNVFGGGWRISSGRGARGALRGGGGRLLCGIASEQRGRMGAGGGVCRLTTRRRSSCSGGA